MHRMTLGFTKPQCSKGLCINNAFTESKSCTFFELLLKHSYGKTFRIKYPVCIHTGANMNSIHKAGGQVVGVTRYTPQLDKAGSEHL